MAIIDFIQVSIDGLLYGSSYSLLAISFSLTFGLMKRINLAFGSTLLFAGAISIWLSQFIAIGIFGTLIVVLFFSMLANLYVEKLCFAPHRKGKGAVVSMIASFAIWMQLDEISSQLLPDRTHSFPELEIPSLYGETILIRGNHILHLTIAVLMVIILFLIIYKTRYGILMRAVSERPETANLLGFNVERVNKMTFALAGISGGMAAFLILTSESQITPFFGVWCTIKGLVAMMLGGVGSLVGALIGGLVLGLVEAHLTYQVGANYREIITYALLFFIIIIFPGGIMGNTIYRNDKSATERI